MPDFHLPLSKIRLMRSVSSPPRSPSLCIHINWYKYLFDSLRRPPSTYADTSRRSCRQANSRQIAPLPGTVLARESRRLSHTTRRQTSITRESRQRAPGTRSRCSNEPVPAPRLPPPALHTLYTPPGRSRPSTRALCDVPDVSSPPAPASNRTPSRHLDRASCARIGAHRPPSWAARQRVRLWPDH